MVADNPLSFRPNSRGDVCLRVGKQAHLMSVRSVLHKIADEMNRPHFHDEIEEPEAETSDKAAEKEEPTDAEES